MTHLWQVQQQKHLDSVQPLSSRMRPTRLDDFIGQKHILGPGRLLRRMIDAGQLRSIILYGPPGTGKTTLARLLASEYEGHFESANSATVGVKDVRLILDSAIKRLKEDARKTIFFLDEIHRFNKAQQDVLLADVERGAITLIGATTENPYFSVNSALVSRSQIFQFEPLSRQDIREVIVRALSDKQNGFGQMNLTISDEAIDHWIELSDGDARRALSALELAVLSESKSKQSPASDKIHIDLSIAEEAIQQKAIQYDRDGDQHYDTASALIKSMRGSDPDASVYWLAKMLTAGEDPRFIARRIAILASEDIGNADPRAIMIAQAAFDIVERIGMPEAQLTLAHAVIYMACTPKSNRVTQAIFAANKDVREGRTMPVPKHLRDSHYAGASQFGHGENYQYAHNSEHGYVKQEYLGVDKTYYEPTQRGYEKHIARYLAYLKDLDQEKKSE